MNTICGVQDKIFWVAQYDEFTVQTIVKIAAYNSEGNLTKQVNEIFSQIDSKIHLGSPIEVIANILQHQKINAFLTPERQMQISDLFKNKQ